MHVKHWITRVRKPGLVQVAAVSMIALMAVGAIVLVAHQATPSVSASASVKAAAPSAPAPVAKATSANPKTAHGAAAVHVPEIVTLTGCLEQKDDSFRLKDTSGADAPKSRSWKTLGLTKHASTISLIDTSNRLKLGTHVGQRVSVTGALVDKDLQGKSLKSLSPSCE